MDALTTQDVTEHFTPGDTVRGTRGDVHTVFKVLHTGYGFTGVLLTSRSNGNGHVTYCTWVVSAEGRARCTMTTDDFPAASGAFEARVITEIRAEFNTEKGSAA